MSTENADPVSFETVRKDEALEIAARRKELGIEDESEAGNIGLSISGGGIRSATFSLGILQKLAALDILRHVDYISTVSGGGYIGSWLCSWIRSEQIEPACAGEPKKTAGEKFETVMEKLNPKSGQPEPEQITFLRQYSSYLTPRTSLFDADTWLIAALWTRNTILDLAILIAVLGAAVLLVRTLGLMAAELLSVDMSNPFGWPLFLAVGLLIPLIAVIGWSLWRNSTIALDPDRKQEGRTAEASNTVVRIMCIFPLLSAIVYSVWLDQARKVFVDGTLWTGVFENFVALSVFFLIFQICGRVYKCHIQKEKEIAGERATILSRASILLLYLIAPAAAGFVTAALLRVVALILSSRHPQPDEPWFVLTCGPPLVLIALALGVVLHIGLMGRDLPEASREWLGRLRAWLMVFTLFWLAVVGLSVYGPWLLLWLGAKSKILVGTLGASWITAIVGGLFAGKSGKTKGRAANNAAKSSGSPLLEFAALAAPYLFVVGFSISVATGIHAILAHKLPSVPAPAAETSRVEKYDLKVEEEKIRISKELPHMDDTGFQWALSRYWKHLSATEFLVENTDNRWPLSGVVPLFGLLVVAGALLAWRVDINLFSMHNFYKNRLVRCYLGASRQKTRRPNPFTGFDDYDDVVLDKFRQGNDYYGPYPIINAALNVTSGGKLQFQERQAQSFIFTPRYTGFSAETVVDEMRLGDSHHPDALYQAMESKGKDDAEKVEAAAKAEAAAEVKAEPAAKVKADKVEPARKPEEPKKPQAALVRKAWAYRPTKYSAGGVSMGMAVAISGAAVNPNMGYHTSLAVSFLLTVFNVRLGWWLGNSLKQTFRRPGPGLGILYLFRELFGMANADSAFVNLSDGGHFDNMGLYELVRRKCRYIICCDGEQDREMTFNGIGNAIRKCRTDLGVEIDLPVERLIEQEGFSRAHCAVGRITYRDKTQGYLVYLKSSLTGDEPTDVLEYHKRHDEFPHETTGDQWFSESQFESYRRLGYHIAERAFPAGNLAKHSTKGRDEYFADLFDIWYPPSVAVDRASPYHAETYARILDAVRREEHLDKLDPQLFKGFPQGVQHDHNSLHICNGLIQLMERVFYELGLEHPEEREHPYVHGWIDIFKYWSQQESFKQAWQATQGSYPRRFRRFYESL